MPKIFRMTKGGKINEDIWVGSTINTPSLLANEDYLDALVSISRCFSPRPCAPISPPAFPHPLLHADARPFDHTLPRRTGPSRSVATLPSAHVPTPTLLLSRRW